MFTDIVRLFNSPTRLKLLKFFVYQPHTRISVKTASGTLGIPEARVTQELRALVRFGFLIKRTQGKMPAFELNQSYSLADSLADFLEKATRVEDHLLTEIFRGTRGILRVVASGALLGEKRSSIDLLVIVRKKGAFDHHVARAVKRAERLVALPLRYAVLEQREFEERLEARDRLLRDVFEFKHSLLLGRDIKAG